MESRGWKMIRGGSCNTHRSVSRRAHFPRDLLVLGGREARARAAPFSASVRREKKSVGFPVVDGASRGLLLLLWPNPGHRDQLMPISPPFALSLSLSLSLSVAREIINGTYENSERSCDAARDWSFRSRRISIPDAPSFIDNM